MRPPRLSHRRLRATALAAFSFCSLACLLGGASLLGSCSDEGEHAPRTLAQRITGREQLVGGPTALGAVGDYLLANDQIRVVVQDIGFNRGSGVFGGSLIDADLVRPSQQGDVHGGNGLDTFGELFPAFFLEMINPETVEIVSDGGDGEAASVEIRGRGGEFVTMIRYLNQILVNSYPVLLDEITGGVPASSDKEPLVEFSTRFELEPGARHVRIESTMRNISFAPLDFPDPSIIGAMKAVVPGLQLDGFRLPMGHVLGFGARSDIFLPGIGYDLRYGLEEASAAPVELPAVPGLLTDLVASSSTAGVSYGFATIYDEETNFAFRKDRDDLYPGRTAEADDLLFLFYASGFGGVFSAEAPARLAPSFCREGVAAQQACTDAVGECSDEACSERFDACMSGYASCLVERQAHPSAFTFTNYFIVGDGSVASIWEELYRIRGIDTAAVGGRVIDEATLEPVGEHVEVLIYAATSASCDGAPPYSQTFTNSEGLFRLALPPGDYCYRARADGRPLGELRHVRVGDSGATPLRVIARSSGRVEVQVTNLDGVTMPSKITVVGTHTHHPNLPTREFLFDLSAGEAWRATDMVPDTADPHTRRFIEATAFAGGDGRASVIVRPGTYTVYVSRGPEYALFSREIIVAPGGVARVGAALEQVVETPGYISGDFHLHAAGSIDSGLDYNRRILSVAGEGLESAVATDHNYISDYAPYILRNGLQPWLRSVVGLELTTFESGHFNGFPLRRDVASPNRGSFAWQRRPPAELFAQLRSMAPPGGNVIQVNHPRTPILGYFTQYNLDPFDATVELPINEAEGEVDRVVTNLMSSSGPAFVETTYDTNGNPDYESTFSWDFDALELFNGPHLEELRHFRMPFDKNASSGDPHALPQATLDGFRQAFLAELEPDALNAELAAFDGTSEAEIAALPAAERDALIDAWVFSKIPEAHTILCDGDDTVYEGGLDDWYNLLNTRRPDGSYRRYTATGNSDSHTDHLDEAGYPRNYYWVGHDSVEHATDADLVQAMRRHRNIVTNGPFVNLRVRGGAQEAVVGDEITADGPVSLQVTIRAADWVGADRFRIIANGEVLRGLDPAQDEGFWGWIPVELQDGAFERTFTVDLAGRDTWLVLEVEGDNNLFPVVAPQEEEHPNFDAIIGSLVGAFGLAPSIPGLEPDYTFAITPFAFTNPIWIVADGDGEFTPAAPPVGRCVDGEWQEPTPAGALLGPDALSPEDLQRRLKAAKVPTLFHEHSPLERPQGEIRDLRVIFDAFGGHDH